MHTQRFRSLLVGALLALGATQAQATFRLSAEIQNQTSSILELAILLDATDGDAIVGFGLDLTFNSSLVSVTGGVDAQFDASASSMDLSTPGTARLLGLQNLPATNLSGTGIALGLVDFSIIGTGTAVFDFAFPNYNPPALQQGLFPPSFGQPVLPDLSVPTSTEVTAATAPSTAFLLAPALILLWRSARRFPAPGRSLSTFDSDGRCRSPVRHDGVTFGFSAVSVSR